MTDLGGLLVDLSQDWQYSVPPIVLFAFVLAWYGGARSDDLPGLGARPVPRVLSNDPVSLAYRELKVGYLRPQVERLWHDVDTELYRRHRVRLRRLPLRRAAAETKGIPNLSEWRELRHDLLRLLWLSDVVIKRPGRVFPSHRRHQREAFEALAAEVLPEAERLATPPGVSRGGLL